MFWLSPLIPGLLLIAAYYALLNRDRRIAWFQLKNKIKQRWLRIMLGTIVISLMLITSYNIGRSFDKEYIFITRMSDAPIFIIAVAVLTTFALDTLLSEKERAWAFYYGLFATVLGFIAITTYFRIDGDTLEMRRWRFATVSQSLTSLKEIKPLTYNAGDPDNQRHGRTVNMLMKFEDDSVISTRGIVSAIRLKELHQSIKELRPDLFQATPVQQP